MPSARSHINSRRDYERFLRKRGFSKREACMLAKHWTEVETIRAEIAERERLRKSLNKHLDLS